MSGTHNTRTTHDEFHTPLLEEGNATAGSCSKTRTSTSPVRIYCAPTSAYSSETCSVGANTTCATPAAASVDTDAAIRTTLAVCTPAGSRAADHPASTLPQTARTKKRHPCSTLCSSICGACWISTCCGCPEKTAIDTTAASGSHARASTAATPGTASCAARSEEHSGHGAD